MALDELFEENELLVPELSPNPVQANTRSDVMGAAYVETAKNYVSDARARAAYNLSLERNREYSKITGRSFEDDFRDFDPEFSKNLFSLTGELSPAPYVKTDELLQAFDNFIEAKRAENPKLDALKTRGQIDLLVNQEALQAKQDYVRVKRGAPEGFLTFASGALGSAAGAMTDPQNIYASVATLGLSAGSTFLKTVLREAMVNMASEIPIQQDVQKFQQELGEEYGLKEKLSNVFSAGLGGGIFGGIGYFPAKALANQQERATKELMEQILKKIEAEKEFEMKAAMELIEDANRVADYTAPLDAAPITIETKQNLLQKVDDIIETGTQKDFDELVDNDFLNPEMIRRVKDPELREMLEARLDIAKAEAKVAQVRGLVDEGVQPSRIEGAIKAARRALKKAGYPDEEIDLQIKDASLGTKKAEGVSATEPSVKKSESESIGLDSKPSAEDLAPVEKPIDIVDYHKKRAENYASPSRDAERIAALKNVKEFEGKLKADAEKLGLNPALLEKELERQNALAKAINKCAVSL